MPSPQFIKSYFSSFTDDIISQPLQKGEKKDEDKDKEGEAAEVSERSGLLPCLSVHHDLLLRHPLRAFCRQDMGLGWGIA